MAQIDWRIAANLHSREVPHARYKRAQIGFARRAGLWLWRRQEQRVALRIQQDGGRELEFHRGALLAFLGDRVHQTLLARLAELADRAEEALGRSGRAQDGTKFHHGLI